MSTKKVNVRINFKGFKFSPDLATTEKEEALVQGEIPIVRNWGDDELFVGADRNASYLCWISLILAGNNLSSIENKLSGFSSYTIEFNKFNQFDSLSFSFEGDSIIVNGSINLMFTVKKELYSDFLNHGQLIVDQLGFRLKGSTDIFVFTKYGKNWELERNDKSDYINNLSDDYISGRPEIVIG
jgi:hypothetical protein